MLCIRVCNVLGLTVDGSTARKIAFFQSGPSTYDLVTQQPLNPDKSARLINILNSGNFIFWFRQLLSSRHVEVGKVLYGHGCEKFRANNASGLFALLKAIEADETTVKMPGTFLDLKVLSEYIKNSTVAREAGERPSSKINEMIKTGQLQWTEARHSNGRLYGYHLPTVVVRTPSNTVRPDADMYTGTIRRICFKPTITTDTSTVADGHHMSHP